MKTFITNCAKSAFLFLLILSSIHTTFAQSSNDKDAKLAADIKSMVTAQNYVFKAQYANPLRGGNLYLTGDYDFTVSKDSLVAYLPFFGRAFTAPVNPEESSMMFTVVNFDYKITAKKYGWDIFIKPKDAKRANSITLNISSNGNATLQIISNDRDAISYQGYIVPRKQKV